MFIRNFCKVAYMESKAQRIYHDLSKFVNHDMFVSLRMQVATAQKLKDADIGKLTQSEYDRFFPSSKLNIQQVAKAAAEDRKSRRTEADEGSSKKGKDEKADKPKEKKEERNVYLPSDAELVKNSDLWEALSIGINLQRSFFISHSKGLCKHVEESILSTIRHNICEHSDRQIMLEIADIIARADALH